MNIEIKKMQSDEEINSFPWKGSFTKDCATWETHDIETALSLLWHVHEYIRKK